MRVGILADFLFSGRNAHPNSLCLITYDALIKQIQREVVIRMRIASKNRPLLLAFNSIPKMWQLLSIQVFGEPDEAIRKAAAELARGFCSGKTFYIPAKNNVLSESDINDHNNHIENPIMTVTINPAARQYYEQFEYDLNGVQTHLSEKLRREYTANASVLNECAKYFDAGDKKTALTILESSRETIGHTLPRSLDRFEDKVRQYQLSGFEGLISGKVGNKNTLKITAEASQQIIALKRSRVPVYTDTQILNKFNSIAAEKGWEQLKSIRSLKQFLNRSDIEPLWYDAVYGELKAAQRYNRRHQTELPQLRDALWYGDGTKLNLYYRGDDGKMRTTMVYEVMDAYSEVLLGYFISDTEDHEAQYHAYRMAIRNSLHKPYEIVHDNQGGHKRLDASELFEKICHIHRTTAPHNPESKTIESAFGRLQADILHQDWRFTGQNITSNKTASRPNLEFIEANRDKLYTLNELKDAYAEARRQWNEAVHPATGIPRIEMYENSTNPETQPVTYSDMVEMFWLITDEPSTFTSQGIEITVKGNKYRYEVFASPGVPDHEWRRAHTFQRFYVKYDPFDMTSVRLYWKDTAGELRFERVAEPYFKIHRAKQEQEESEAAFIQQEREANLNDRIERQIVARTIEVEHGVAPEQNGLRSPKLNIPASKRDELQRQCDRRTKIYSRNPEEYQTGRANKIISLTTYDELEGETNFDVKKAAKKL
jgi:hypothetical protein